MGLLNKLSRGMSFKCTEKGCFTVYVGQEKQRFTVKAECANHPLFGILLEEAATEYGYQSAGPIVLPCDVHLFCKVLAEIDVSDQDDGISGSGRRGSFGRSSLSYFSPSRRKISSQNADERGSGSYSLLSPTSSFKKLN